MRRESERERNVLDNNNEGRASSWNEQKWPLRFRHLRLTKVAVTKAGGDALPRNGDRLKYFSFDLEHPMDAVISVTRKKIAKCLILL